MNRYHYYLNLPFEIQKPKVFDTQHSVAKHEVLPMDLPEAQYMIEFLSQFSSVECKKLEYFYTPPNGGKIFIHSDNQLDNMTKFNITWGPEQGVVRWWDCPSYSFLNLDPGNSQYGNSDTSHSVYVADEKDSTLMYQANTNRISMLNVGPFHSTYNPGTEGRYTLCFLLFYKNSNRHLQWQDAVEIFKEYLDS
jgi:hypothetical protein